MTNLASICLQKSLRQEVTCNHISALLKHHDLYRVSYINKQADREICIKLIN
jgi:hypothetical protein